MIMWLRRSFVLLALATAACKDKVPGGDATLDDTGTVGKNSAVEVMASDKSYTLVLPAGWDGLVRTDTLSAAERGTARPGAFNVVYLPSDTSIIPQTLLVVAVYDSAAWVAVKADGGPPPGDSLMAKNGRVYVLGMPQSNPFTPGSVDALKFDSLAIKPADKAMLIRVP